MSIENILALLGGLALFLYGMKMMSSGLEAAAGNRLKDILEKLTTNRFLGIAVGVGITALIQSSSTTTVMVVGFVNSGIMNLYQALWIIMGANIGTNVTSQLIALDVSEFAPIFALVGVVMVVFLHKKKLHYIGQIAAGLGILFIGMSMMSEAMVPLREEPAFINLMTQFSIPIIGILVGIVFTAIIQSSSASVGILQALAASGLIGLPNAIYVLFGQNIGTCVTALLASAGASRNAKRAAIMHLTFNTIGTTLFVFIAMLTPFTSWMENLTPNNVTAQIANVHLIFNLSTTIILLPFGKWIVKLAEKILPDRASEHEGEQFLKYLDPLLLRNEHQVGTVAIFVAQLRHEVERMLSMARNNIDRSFTVVLTNSEKLQTQIDNSEEYIDYLNKEISYYISHLISLEMTEADSVTINAFFKITGNIERLGDHATNIAGYANLLEDKKLKLSAKALAEVEIMREVSLQSLDLIYDSILSKSPEELLAKMEEAEQKMDDMTREFRRNQMNRMVSNECSGEACVIYSEMLTDFERVGDHLLNIAEAITDGKLKSLHIDDDTRAEMKEVMA
ncbi:MAG TPA: Na/Pi cotransporter family protein [Bacillota bacterium]|nr:Na/Pi cotransporter family protein [Bacillota bacterium]HPE38653.1 Na/Pi cotransporter family protein [Bacillota bacterium]